MRLQCAVPTFEKFIVQLCALFQRRRHSAVVTKVVTVCAQCSACQREEIKKARVNGGTDNDSLKDSHKSLRCR